MLERLNDSLKAQCQINAKRLAEFSRARGRYELANEFWAMYVAGVREGAKPAPKMTKEKALEYRELARMIGREAVAEERKMDAEIRRDMKQLLKEVEPYQREFPLLVETRSALVAVVESSPEGLKVSDIQKQFRHGGSTSMGVIINQLARGEWIHRESDKARIVYPKKKAMLSDVEFFRSEIATQFAEAEPEVPSRAPVRVVRISDKGTVIKERRKGSISCMRILAIFVVVLLVMIVLTSLKR